VGANPAPFLKFGPVVAGITSVSGLGGARRSAPGVLSKLAAQDRTPGGEDGITTAGVKQRAEAVAVYPLSTAPEDIKRIAEFAVKNRLPTVTNTVAYIKEGILAGYGPNVPDQYQRAASYIDRVLKGARPADLPVEQPTMLDLVINGRTAKALGLTLPQAILLRAVEVVE
jgi:putative ABC transport system substrate-binding protein